MSPLYPGLRQPLEHRGAYLADVFVHLLNDVLLLQAAGLARLHLLLVRPLPPRQVLFQLPDLLLVGEDRPHQPDDERDDGRRRRPPEPGREAFHALGPAHSNTPRTTINSRPRTTPISC